jgi:protein TonB
MTAAAFPRIPSSRQRFPCAASTKRFSASALISILLHVVAAGFSGGNGSRPGSSAPPQTLSVRLVQVAPDAAEERQAVVTAQADTPEPAEPARRRLPTPLPVRARAESKHVDARPAAGTSSTGAAVAEAPDHTYYGAKQLDIYPALAAPLDLLRSEDAASASGRALWLVLIDASGAVNDVSLVEASPASLPEAVSRRAFMSARFTPAYRNGRAVRSRMLIEVSYGEGR